MTRLSFLAVLFGYHPHPATQHDNQWFKMTKKKYNKELDTRRNWWSPLAIQISPYTWVIKTFSQLFWAPILVGGGSVINGYISIQLEMDWGVSPPDKRSCKTKISPLTKPKVLGIWQACISLRNAVLIFLFSKLVLIYHSVSLKKAPSQARPGQARSFLMTASFCELCGAFPSSFIPFGSDGVFIAFLSSINPVRPWSALYKRTPSYRIEMN